MSGIYLMLFGLCTELCLIGQNDGHCGRIVPVLNLKICKKHTLKHNLPLKIPSFIYNPLLDTFKVL